MDPPRLTHVRVDVRDLVASIVWHERLLDVKPEGHWPPEAPTYVHSNVREVQFALGEYEPAPATGARFDFEVTDVDAWWERLGSDSDVLKPLLDTPYGTRKLTIS